MHLSVLRQEGTYRTTHITWWSRVCRWPFGLEVIVESQDELIAPPLSTSVADVTGRTKDGYPPLQSSRILPREG
jgi:hypothetical protein